MPIYSSSISTFDMEQALFSQVNTWREKKGLDPFKLNIRLQQLARSYSQDMAKRNFFSHQDPDGRKLDERLRACGINFCTAGENLAKIMSNRPQLQLLSSEVFNGWLTSSGHRKNIEAKEFIESGLGTFAHQHIFYITQIFLRK